MRFVVFFFLFLVGCAHSPDPIADSLVSQLQDQPRINGMPDYASSPYVTAGDQLYVVGHQNGRFPPLGWHISGEMGGVWAHPIKLLDGYRLQLMAGQQRLCNITASQFANFPQGALLEYQAPEINLKWSQFQFVPDDTPGLIVEYTLYNEGPEPMTLDLFFQTEVDLRPTWLAERTNTQNGTDQLLSKAGDSLILVTDSSNPWTVGIATNAPATMQLAAPACRPEFPPGMKGLITNLRSRITLENGQSKTVRYAILGNHQSSGEIPTQLQKLLANAPELLQKKVDRYNSIQQSAQLIVPDSGLTEAFQWTKYNSDWLQFEVPGIGTGIAAGIPDYPWWFGCDQTYTVRGLLPAGMPDLARKVLETLLMLSDSTNGNGQIIHEASSNGAVFNPGNLNETPHFIATCWDYFRWTADSIFLAKAYPYCKKGIDWLEAQDVDGNGYPDGHGMMEIRGMDAEMIDVIAYAAEAYFALAKMATYFNEKDLGANYREKGVALSQKIEAEWWVASAKSFADFRAYPTKAQQLLKDAILRADTLNKPWSVSELNAVQIEPSNTPQPYAFFHNWVVNTPMEIGLVDTTKALQALQSARKYINPFGTYVTGIDRKAAQGNIDGFAALKSKESFNYTGAVMTLPTGVQAIAEAQYGRIDTAYDYLQRLVRSFSYAAPGSMYEVSPDYGMLVQAWNIYALARPLVAHFLGIQPEAHRKVIRIHPQLPSSWDYGSIRALPIGDGQLDLNLKKGEWEAHFSQSGWTINWVFPQSVLKVVVNGEVQPTKPRGRHRVISTSSESVTLSF